MAHLFLQIGPISKVTSDTASTIQDWISYFGLNTSATKILGGILVLIIGFFISKYFSSLISKLIGKMGIDDKMKGNLLLSSFVGKLIYFVLMIIVLLTALNMMGVGDQVMQPLNVMVQKFTNAIPNIIISGIIIYAGYFLAKLVAEFIEFSGDTLKNYAPKMNLPEDLDLVKIIKSIVFIFIFIPILIVGLDFLHFDAITKPATNLLAQFMDAIPLIVKAVAIMIVAVFGGKLLVGLLKELLINLKVDSLSDKIGFQNLMGKTSISGLTSNLVLFFIIYSAIMQSLDVLGLGQISDILNEVLHIAGKVAFGLIILALGNLVANFAVQIFSKGKSNNEFTLSIMKGAIIIIFLAMGLNAMDIADDIINLAFGLGLGAIAIAFALSFGLGGKEAAGQEMKKFFEKLNKKN